MADSDELLPHLMAMLEREPTTGEITAIGNEPTRLELSDGTVRFEQPMASTDEALERAIRDIAASHHLPFSSESPFIDCTLTPRLRLHGAGFDATSRPTFCLRVHRGRT